MDDIVVLTHDGHFVHKGELRLSIDDVLECVGHNGDEHIQEHDLGEESGGEEDQPAEVPLWMVFEAIDEEFAKPQQVLVDERIEEKVTERGFNHSIIL